MPLVPLTSISTSSPAAFDLAHGNYFQAAIADKVFQGGTLIAGVAIPVMAATLASKFTLWNPVGSGVVAEPIVCGFGITSATTVVNGIGYAILYNVSQLSTGLPTAPTFAAGAAQTNAAVGNGGVSVSGKATPKCGLYSALTLTNAAVFGPVVMMKGGFGAVTDGSLAPDPYYFNGTVCLPPDSLLTLVTNVIVETAMTASLQWAEW